MESLKGDKKLCCHENLGLLVKVLVVFLSVLTLSFAIGAWNKIKESKYIGQDIMMRNTISVSGIGEVYAKPDLGLVNFSVKTEAKTVIQAMSENTKKMNKVVETIKALEVEDKDLKTTQFDLYPRYEYQGDKLSPLEEKRVLVGYDVSQSLQVKIRDLEKVGQIIEKVAEAGANQIGDLIFTIDDRDEIEKEAREKAIKEAKEMGKEIANKLGVSLVRIVNFSENSTGYRYYDGKGGFGIGGGEAALSMPQIETGESKVEVSVYITYEIN